jgi:ABC-type sugar transport system substrate-binding protein
MKKVVLFLVAVLLVVSLVACAAPVETAQEPAEEPAENTAEEVVTEEAPADDPIRIAYISKMLSHPWFIAEDEGMKAKAAELGVEYFSIDANLDDEACDAAIDNALAQDIDGLAICITNQGNGPALAMKCEEAGVALITIDDSIVDGNGAPVPHVGMPTKDVGVIGGEMLAKYANERGFFAEGNVVAVMQIDAPDISVLKPRLDGYQEALIANTPLTEADFIYVETTECMLEDSLAAAQATIQAHPEVTHWITGGVNDDTAVAMVKALEEQGTIPQENILACGLGGYALAIEEFKKGNDGFMCVVLNPYGEGEAAMEILYNYIVNGTAMPETTYINGFVATLDNWTDYITE